PFSFTGISSFSDGSGAAGDVHIAAPTLSIYNRGVVFTRGAASPAGNIDIRVDKLILQAPTQDHLDASGIGSHTLGSAAAAAFPDAAHAASWAGLAPGNHQSGGKRRSGRTNKGNRCFLRPATTI